MSPLQFGAIGLIGWGAWKILGKKKSPLSTQAVAVTPQSTMPSQQPTATAATKPADAATAAIQNRLNILGANPPLVVDGISGPLTLAAIRAFQSSRGIEPDGIVGPITLAALGLGPAVQTATPAYTPSTASSFPAPSPTVIPTAASSPNIHVTQETWADEPTQSLVDHF